MEAERAELKRYAQQVKRFLFGAMLSMLWMCAFGYALQGRYAVLTEVMFYFGVSVCFIIFMVLGDFKTTVRAYKKKREGSEGFG